MTKAGGLGDWCHSGPASGKEPFARKGDQAEIWAVGVHSYMLYLTFHDLYQQWHNIT